MRRREFMALLGGAAATWPLGARAEQTGQVRRLGVLMAPQESDPEGKAQLSGFKQALATLGWIEGRNLQMEIRGVAATPTMQGFMPKSWSPYSPT